MPYISACAGHWRGLKTGKNAGPGFICVVLLGAYWLVYRSLPVEDPVWRLSQAGLTLAVIFLALSVE